MDLKKKLNSLDIFAISSGAMISSGIFILPGLAYAKTGAGVFLSYGIAGIVALIGLLDIVELATAMPKAGGDYYFITRSMGPLIGTLAGVLSYSALILKTSFAIFGAAEICHILSGINVLYFSFFFCIIFTFINIKGIKEASGFQVFLVLALLIIMLMFILRGTGMISIANFTPLSTGGFSSIFRTAGFVFISYGGLLKAASVAEEVKNPKKNIPPGLLLSIVVVSVLYTLITCILVGVMKPYTLAGSLTPIADASRVLFGNIGYIIIIIASFFAFFTTANAGIMAASRYPFALARDGLFPGFLMNVSKKTHTPILTISVTGVFIFASLFLDLETLVKAASAVVLASYALSAAAVIILHESRVHAYKPSFKVPFYPFIQIGAIIIFGILAVEMGRGTPKIIFAVMGAALIIYLLYGSRKYKKDYALLYIVEKVVNRKLTSQDLETELLEIIHIRDDVTKDRVDHILQEAEIIDLAEFLTHDEFFHFISDRIRNSGCDAVNISELLMEREKESSTVITPFVAVPHLVLPGKGFFKLLIIRSREGIHFSDEYRKVKAIFMPLGTFDERNTHLRTLTAIAQIIQQSDFEKKWSGARNADELRSLLLSSSRKRQKGSKG